MVIHEENALAVALCELSRLVQLSLRAIPILREYQRFDRVAEHFGAAGDHAGASIELETVHDQAQAFARRAQVRLGPTADPAARSLRLADRVIVDELAQRLCMLGDAIRSLHAHLEHRCTPHCDRTPEYLAALSTAHHTPNTLRTRLIDVADVHERNCDVHLQYDDGI